MPSPAIVYAGPSVLDGSPIVAIMTGHDKPSKNAKTGEIPQVYIMRADVEPHTAAIQGSDSAICGDCPLRPSVAADGVKPCYVTVFRAPLSMYRAYHRGSYAPLDPSAIKADTIRIGAYGDPAAVPMFVWEALERDTGARILGYTHQWRRFPEISRYAMASVETLEGAAAARALGFRTFRVMKEGIDTLTKGEAGCPASKEQGYRKTCATCRACDGSARGAQRASIAIYAH